VKSPWEEQHFILAPTIEDVLKVLKGETTELQLEADIQLEAALQALHDGFSLTEIIQQAVYQLEKYVIAQILEFTNGNKAEAARILKVDYKTLYRKMYKYFDTFPNFLSAFNSNGQSTSTNTGTNQKPTHPT
jgi:DNA-binding NtrC family response regulator